MEREEKDREDSENHGSRLVWQGRLVADEPDLPTRSRLLFRSAVDPRPPAGDREARSAVAASVDPPVARSNWMPIGPRNVAGRVKALAVSPADDDVWYAGSAAGGLYRSTNRGLSWERLWEDQPSLSIGAIAAVADPADPGNAGKDRVMVATGEILEVPGAGLWVSDDAGDRASWRAGNPTPPNDIYVGGMDAIAIDPGDRNHAWAVGANGAFRTLNGGTDWEHLDAGVYWSDAHFAGRRLFLARGGRFVDGATVTARALMCRLDDPTTAGVGDLTDAANVSVIVDRPSTARSWPARVKFVMAPSNANTIYAAVVDDRELGRLIGVFRTTRANRATNDFRWQRLAYADDFDDENQGVFDLAIAVHPTQVGTVALGLTSVYVSTNAAGSVNSVTFSKAMAWQLHDELRAHHADNHQLVAVSEELWVANDSGISMCDNWRDANTAISTRLPLNTDTFNWHSRDDGISGSMFYDINHSPLLPGVVAGGFQDNGTHMTASSHTWRNINGADGAFAAFDPDDPFAMLVTTQNGIDRLRFPGHRDLQFPDEQPSGPIPEVRRLRDGFRRFDPPLFVAETVRHARDRSRVFHGRVGRLYGLRASRGERWEIEPVGRGFELRVSRQADPANRLKVTIADTPGAHRLGLVPSLTERRRHDDPTVDPPPRELNVAFVSHLPAPYELESGDVVKIRIDDGSSNVEHTVTFTAASAVILSATTTTEVVAAFNNAGIAGLEALPRFWHTPTAVELITESTGSGSSITLGGTAVGTADAPPTILNGLSRLGLNAGTYKGHDGLPTSITIANLPPTRADQVINRRFPAGSRTLTVAIDGRAPVTVNLDSEVPDPNWVTAPELAAALGKALENEPVRVIAASRQKLIALTAKDGHTVVVSGTAAERLNLPTFPRVVTVINVDAYWADNMRLHLRNHLSFDFTPPDPATPLELQISDGANSATVTFDGSGIADLRCVTVEELFRLIDRALDVVAPSVAVAIEFVSYMARGAPTEMATSRANPDHLWVGTADGLVERSTDNGANWITRGRGKLDQSEARVEAIVLHPTEANIGYVGTWAPIDVPAHNSQLHRTNDGGISWEPRGIEFGGHEVGIRALELHPDDPRTLFAATDNGVFFSPDEGQNWTAFNHGLPAVGVIDLAVDRDGPYLIAATWGGGAYRRYVGSGPADDVRLHVRASDLDHNGDRPVAGEPDLFGVTAASSRAVSPDIVVTRGNVPATITDGVRLDLDTFDEVPVDDQDAVVLVQVHNRGSQAARFGPGANDPKVRVVILRTNVGRSIPDLPADFWTRFRASTLKDMIGAWHVTADTTLPAALEPDTPHIVREVIDGADRGVLANTGPRLGFLVLVSHPDDELTGAHIEVDKLLDTERRAAYREVGVLHRFEDNRIVVRSTTREPVEIINDPSPRNSPAAGRLRLPAPAADTSIVANAPAPGDVAYDFDVGAAASRTILIAQSAGRADLEFDNSNGEFADLSAARAHEIAAFIHRRLTQAGLPVICLTNEDHLRIRALGGATVEVRGGTSTGGPRLNFAPAGANPAVTSPSSSRLPVNGTIDLRVQTPGRTDDITVTLENNRAWEQAGVLNRQFADRGLDGVLQAESPVGIFLFAMRRGDHEVSFTLSGPDLGLFNLPAGTDNLVEVAFGPLDLSTNPRFTITSSHEMRVRFRRDAAMSPAEARRTINEALLTAQISGRAEPAVVRLRVGASTTDRGPAPARTGGAALADIATSGTSAAPTPADLFDLRAALSDDELSTGAANNVYVRAANQGNISTTSGRFRLYRIEIGSPTITPHLSDDVDLEVAESSIAIAQLSHTPTAVAGEVEIVMAVVDQDQPARTTDPPASWADLDTFLAWVADRPSVSVRRFDVA